MTKEEISGGITVEGKTIPAGYEFMASKTWWQNVFTRRWPRLNTKNSKYRSVEQLTPFFANSLNGKIKEMLLAGTTLVLANSDSYHILYPIRNLLIPVEQSQVVELVDSHFLIAVPAYPGTLRAELSVGKRNDNAFFNITCGELSFSILFKNNDPTTAPTLFALNDDFLKPKPTLLFGRFTYSRLKEEKFLRLKNTA